MPPLKFVQTNGIRMGYYEAGPTDDKPPIVLCHGWPELAFSWRHQIKALSEDRQHGIPELFSFLSQLVINPEKIVVELADLPELPESATVPEDDKLIVRSALSSHVPIVTTDSRLRNSVNGQEILGTKAIDPKEALELAKDR